LAHDNDIGDENVEEVPEARQTVGWARRVVRIVLALVLLPYVLIFLYRIDFIHPVSTLMLADLATFQGYDRRWVEFDSISPHLVRAVMMSEDGQFCAHMGVDWEQMKGVVDDALSGEATRGASTIPMQTVKNLFLWNSRSMIRKGLELAARALRGRHLAEEADHGDSTSTFAEWGPGILRHRGGSAVSLQDLCGETDPWPIGASGRLPAQSDRSSGRQAGLRA